MKKYQISCWAALTMVCAALLGCDSSKEPSTPTPESAKTPEPSDMAEKPMVKEAVAPESTASEQVKTLATETVQSAKDSVASATTKLTESLQGSTDGKLTELAGELTEKVKSLSSTLTSDAPLKEKLQTAVESLSSGQDGESLGALQQIKEANLTAEQTQLVQEVQNVWSALVVQKNFAGLTGAESEVGSIVNALKGGDTATALTNLKQLSSKATLSQPQKDLLGTIVAQYAPGLEGAGDAVKEGLKSINPFGK